MSRRDSLPPCDRCGVPKGAHTMACPVPAIRRAVKSINAGMSSGDAILADALASMPLERLVTLSRVLDGELDRRGRLSTPAS